MDLYGKESKSFPQKIIMHLIEIALIWLSYWILFQQGGEWCQKHLNIHNAPGNRVHPKFSQEVRLLF